MADLAVLGQRLVDAAELGIDAQAIEAMAVADLLTNGVVGELVNLLADTGGLGSASASPKTWLAHRANIAPTRAGRITRSAKFASRFPGIAAGIEEGVLTDDHIGWLKNCLPGNRTRRRAEQFERDHKMLVDFARDYDYLRFVTLCRNWIEACNAVDPEQKAPKDADLGINFTDNNDGTTSIKGLMLTGDAAALEEALRRLVDDTKTNVMAAEDEPSPKDDVDDLDGDDLDVDDLSAQFRAENDVDADNDWGPVRDPAALDFSISEYTLRPTVRKGTRYWMARAIGLLATKAATAPPHGKSPEPLVVVHIDHETFDEQLETYLAHGPPPEPDIVVRDGYLCEDTNGNPYRPGEVFELALRHSVARCVVGASSRTVDLGRRSRLFTGAARDAVVWRDRTCREPGCDRPGREVDHIEEWDEGGETNPLNANYLCKACHTVKTHAFNQRRYAQQRSVAYDSTEPF